MKNEYSEFIARAEKAGFQIYCDTRNEDSVCGTILTNTLLSSPYNGECIDLFEDGTYFQYCQFKHQQPIFKLT